jgi:hypothetical protein
LEINIKVVGNLEVDIMTIDNLVVDILMFGKLAFTILKVDIEMQHQLPRYVLVGVFEKPIVHL